MSDEEKEILYHIELWIMQDHLGRWKYVRPALPHLDMGEEFINKYQVFFDKVSDYLQSKDWKVVIKGYNNNYPLYLK